jgi:hypothetical protein
MLFNPIYANVAPYPSVTFQGHTNGQVSIFDVGDGVANTGGTSGTGTLDLSGGIVTATVDTFNVGRASGAATGSGTTIGRLQFDAGTITVNTLNCGLQPVTGSKAGVGTVSVNSNATIAANATLRVNGNLNLAVNVNSATTAGTLNLTNGTVLANAIVAGTGSVSAINAAGGHLVVTNAIGSGAAPLGTLTLAPLGTADNRSNVLQLAAGTSASVTVATLNLDAQDTTTNVINVG